jgi:hypothetical protein
MLKEKKSEPVVRIRMLCDVGCGPQKEHPRMPTLESYPTGLGSSSREKRLIAG